MNPLLVPLEGMDPETHGSFLEPLLGFGGTLLIIAMVITALVLLHRRGLLPAFPALSSLARRPSPEEAARQVLAERFARGDISSEDFMERASILNWTPGSDQPTRRRIG